METVGGLPLAEVRGKGAVSRNCASRIVVVRMLLRAFRPPRQAERSRTHLCSCSKMARLRDDCPAILINDEYGGARNESKDNLGIVLDHRRSGKTCKSHHGCSSLERNNDKGPSGGWNQPRDEEPSGVE